MFDRIECSSAQGNVRPYQFAAAERRTRFGQNRYGYAATAQIRRNNCRRSHTRGCCIYLYIVQIEVCVTVTIVARTLEVDVHRIAGKVEQVSGKLGPIRLTGQRRRANQRSQDRISGKGNKYLTSTTGRVLPLELKNSRFAQVDIRCAQVVVLTIRCGVRVHANTIGAIRAFSVTTSVACSAIVAPLVGIRGHCTQ